MASQPARTTHVGNAPPAGHKQHDQAMGIPPVVLIDDVTYYHACCPDSSPESGTLFCKTKIVTYE